MSTEDFDGMDGEMAVVTVAVEDVVEAETVEVAVEEIAAT